MAFLSPAFLPGDRVDNCYCNLEVPWVGTVIDVCDNSLVVLLDSGVKVVSPISLWFWELPF